MKVIFLDIDGVLNYQASGAMHRGGIGIEQENVKHLAYIVEHTGAVIVLTSTWKLHWSNDKDNQHPSGAYIDQVLSEFGLGVLDKTPLSVSQRGAGIQKYLEEHNVDSWVVLDDEIFPDFEQYGILPRLVKSSFYKEGLTHELAQKAIQILNCEE